MRLELSRLAFLAAAAVGIGSFATLAPAVQDSEEPERVRPDRGPRIEEGRDRVTAAAEAVELEAHVGYLASDALAGRDTGSAGETLAVEYIVGQLEACGWQPATVDETGAPSFLQRVPLTQSEVTADPRVTVAGADAPAVWGADYTVIRWAPVDAELDVVVAASVDDLPATDQALYVPASTRDRGAVLETLAARGADAPAVVLLPGPKSTGRPGGRLPRPRLEVDDGGAALTVLRVRGDLLAGVESGAVTRIAVTTEVTVEAIESHNVVGILEGTGTPERPELADEVVVLSAHLDHIGQRAPSDEDEPDADLIYNGADDDASGVAAVLEVAEALALGERPARTFVALLATGEERGLLGTFEYIRRPVRPLSETVCNFNFEMLGRPDELAGGPGKMWLTGYELTTLGPAWAELGVELTPDPRPEQRFFQRSDNYAFVMEGIVAQTVSSFDLHEDYHQVSDEWWTLDYEHMAAAVSLAAEAARLLGSGAVTPAWIEGMQPAPR